MFVGQLAFTEMNDDNQGNLHMFSRRLNSWEHPIHLDRAGKFKNHLINNTIHADSSRYRGHIRVGRHLRNETSRIEVTQFVVTYSSSQNGHVVNICIGNHCCERVFRIASGKFILHMIVPLPRQRLLRSAKSLTGKITHEEFQTAEIREFSVNSMIMYTSWTAKRVVAIWISVNGNE